MPAFATTPSALSGAAFFVAAWSPFARLLAAALPARASRHEAPSAKATNAEEAKTRRRQVVPFVDPEDYGQVVDQHYRSLYLFALGLARNEHDAWDLTHETFIRWVRHHHRIRERSRTKTWLFTTLYRAFLDQRRRHGRLAVLEPEAIDQREAFAGAVAEETPDGRGVDKSSMMRALQGLPERYRAPLTLFYLEDCSYREIASILSIRPGTVMSRLSRAKTLLSERLDPASSSCPASSRHES